MNRLYTLFIFMLLTSLAKAQVVVQFIPEINGRSIDGLFGCRTINPSANQVAVILTITVKERKAGTVCVIKTPQFTIIPGTNTIPVNAARSAVIQLGNNKLSQLLSISHLFPEGDYDYCFSLQYLRSDNLPDEQCFSYLLTPFADLSLTDPYNQAKICDKRPLLTWQPLIPGVLGSYYQLVLTEVKDGQNPTEALNYNLPIINQQKIISPVLPYPPSAPELKLKTRYAWQVSAYKDQTIINRSEIWEFTVECKDSVKKIIVNDGYRDIDDLSRGNYYFAVGKMKFAFVNPYQAQDLKYEVFTVAKPDKKIKGLPKVKIVSGINNISINLDETGSFTDGTYYIMDIYLPNGDKKSLRFLYSENK